MKASEISEIFNGELTGDGNTVITGVGKIESAGKNDITFISNPLYEKYYHTTSAGAVLVSKEFKLDTTRTDLTTIRVQDPYTSFISLIEIFEKENETEETGISSNCYIGENPVIDEDVFIDEFVKVGSNCRIGNKTKIKSNCSIGNNVTIGNNCVIEPNVTIFKGCVIGNNVIIHSGTVIGSDGFGFAHQTDGSFRKIPQKGIVVIDDDVEIGSNCCIDRATLGETRICKRVKIDNQVQIAHNVFIDEDTVIVAQAGISGSTRIGKRCMIAGQAGLVGHLTICDDVIIGAASGVSKSITKPGTYTGYRSKPIKEDLKQEVLIRQLEEIKDLVKKKKD